MASFNPINFENAHSAGTPGPVDMASLRAISSMFNPIPNPPPSATPSEASSSLAGSPRDPTPPYHRTTTASQSKSKSTKASKPKPKTTSSAKPNGKSKSKTAPGRNKRSRSFSPFVPTPDINATNFVHHFWTHAIRKAEAYEDDFKETQLPLARIKRVMKTDPEVKMISSEVPVLFAKACEIFISEITARAFLVATAANRRTLHRDDVANAVGKSDVFDFLIDVMAAADDMKGEDVVGEQGGSAGGPYGNQQGTSAMGCGEPDYSMFMGNDIDEDDDEEEEEEDEVDEDEDVEEVVKKKRRRV